MFYVYRSLEGFFAKPLKHINLVFMTNFMGMHIEGDLLGGQARPNSNVEF